MQALMSVGPTQGPRTRFAAIVGLSLAVSAAAVAASVFALAWVSRHERDTTRIHAAILAQDLGSRIAVCADPDRSDLPGRPRRELPPSSSAVPQADKNSATDWQDDAFQCAQFRPLVLLPVQIHWTQVPAKKGFDHAGEVRVSIDLDHDGTTDEVVVTEVACTAAQCTVSPYATMEAHR
jgi:hypothetical protein